MYLPGECRKTWACPAGRNHAWQCAPVGCLRHIPAGLFHLPVILQTALLRAATPQQSVTPHQCGAPGDRQPQGPVNALPVWPAFAGTAHKCWRSAHKKLRMNQSGNFLRQRAHGKARNAMTHVELPEDIFPAACCEWGQSVGYIGHSGVPWLRAVMIQQNPSRAQGLIGTAKIATAACATSL